MKQNKEIKNVICHSHENGNLTKTPVCHKTEPSEAGSPRSRGWQTPPVLRHGGSLLSQSSGIKGKCFGFTLIELLVSISILATISIVGYVSYAGHMKNSYNTTRIETIDSLHLSLSDYSQLKKTLPQPNSNYIPYDERGTYMHSLSGAYGVSGHVSDDFLPKGYVNFSATDPESKQFYGYGKLVDNTSFDLAAALYDDVTGGYKTYLRGTYPRQRLSSLIRAYSSSNFVSQDSTEDLPYNPYERKVTAYVSSSSGTVTLTNDAWVPLSLTGELNSGDTVTVATGSTALLHISDGSELSLGSVTSQTELALSTLSYSDDNNLTSKVALWLRSGEVWTEAPHLRTESGSESDFSIHTDTAVAAVRGTVFGIARSVTGTTSISLVTGKLEVMRITTDTNGEIVTQQAFVSSDGFVNNTTATGWFILDTASSDQKSYMIVLDDGQAIMLNNITNTTIQGTLPSAQTGSITPAELDQIDQKIQHPPFSLGYRPKADSISFSGMAHAAGANTATGILSVTFWNPGADSYYLSFGTGKIDTNQPFPVPDPNPFYTGMLSATGTITITGAFVYIPDPQISRTYTLRVCSHWQCSAPDIKVLGSNEFSFGNFRIWGEENTTLVANAWSWVIPLIHCPTNDPAQTGFWFGDCLTDTNSGLVAYAPYSYRPGSLSGTMGMFTATGNLFLSQNKMDSTDTGKYVPAVDASWTLVSASGTSCSWTYERSIRKTALSNLGMDFSSKFEDYDIVWVWPNSVVEGLYVDNCMNDNYLKYNLSQLGLSGSFSIEMSVRGRALKRNDSSPYYLFDSSSVYLDLYKIWWDTTSSLVLWYHDGSIFRNVKKLSIGSLSDNDFYKVKASFSGSIWTLTISGNNLTASWSNVGSGVGNNITLNSNLFVGSTTASYYQWNDIIDSVKIYNN